jgi:ABC-2 type transport system permease protein
MIQDTIGPATLSLEVTGRAQTALPGYTFAVGPLRAALAFLRRDLLIDLSYRSGVFFAVASGIFALATFYFLSQTVGPSSPALARYGGNYFSFALVGISVMGVLRSALTQMASRVREAQVSGTLEAVLATPLSPAGAIVLSSLYPMGGAALRGIALLTVGTFIFDARISAHVAAALAGLGLSLACFLALGILSAAFTLRFKKGDPLATVIDWLSALLSGVVYPVEVLPPELRAAGELIPTTHALEALRGALMRGEDIATLARPLGILAAFAAVALPLGLWAFRAAVRRSAEDGSLAHF